MRTPFCCDFRCALGVTPGVIPRGFQASLQMSTREVSRCHSVRGCPGVIAENVQESFQGVSRCHSGRVLLSVTPGVQVSFQGCSDFTSGAGVSPVVTSGGVQVYRCHSGGYPCVTPRNVQVSLQRCPGVITGVSRCHSGEVQVRFQGVSMCHSGGCPGVTLGTSRYPDVQV